MLLRLSGSKYFSGPSRNGPQIGYSFGKPCRTRDSEKDYFEQKIGLKPHLQPLKILGNTFIILTFLCNRMLSIKICYEFGFNNRHSNLIICSC